MDAVNILRHEKIGRWVSPSWVWAEDFEYDPEALAIADGKQDRLKQDAIYVRLAVDGGVVLSPEAFTLEKVRSERERAVRLAYLTEGLLRGDACPGLDYEKVEQLFRFLFVSIRESDASA